MFPEPFQHFRRNALQGREVEKRLRAGKSLVRTHKNTVPFRKRHGRIFLMQHKSKRWFVHGLWVSLDRQAKIGLQMVQDSIGLEDNICSRSHCLPKLVEWNVPLKR